MMDSKPPEKEEYTPEQRKLLAKAYRLILSWPREKTEPDQTCSSSEPRADSRKTVRHPAARVSSLPENKQS
ncbi:MAG: hypothetical protein HZB50_03665 [Chloroflexi bacterium]|nr:hypothetical protein [Chloroflexota bacterium]